MSHKDLLMGPAASIMKALKFNDDEAERRKYGREPLSWFGSTMDGLISGSVARAVGSAYASDPEAQMDLLAGDPFSSSDALSRLGGLMMRNSPKRYETFTKYLPEAATLQDGTARAADGSLKRRPRPVIARSVTRRGRRPA